VATLTLGTNATTTLVAIAYNQGSVSSADFASIQNNIKDHINITHPISTGAFSRSGLLYVPNRGVLKVLPGDYVGYDPNGWPILVSAYSIATGGWTHS